MGEERFLFFVPSKLRICLVDAILISFSSFYFCSNSGERVFSFVFMENDRSFVLKNVSKAVISNCFILFLISPMGRQSVFGLYFDRFRKFYLEYRSIPPFSQCMEVIGVASKSVVHRFFQQMLDQ